MFLSLNQYTLLLEARESKNISAARALLNNNGILNTKDVLDELRRKIPNIRVCKCKFFPGVCRLYLANQLNDTSDIAKMDLVLLNISHEESSFSPDLNGLGLQELSHISKKISDRVNNEYRQNIQASAGSDYVVKYIPSFDVAKEYSQYTSWCITRDNNAFDSYGKNKNNAIFFLLKKGFEQISDANQQEASPFDEYGKSMIAVTVSENDELVTSTSRWNHSLTTRDSPDHIYTPETLSKVTGLNFYEVCRHPSNGIILDMYKKGENIVHRTDWCDVMFWEERFYVITKQVTIYGDYDNLGYYKKNRNILLSKDEGEGCNLILNNNITLWDNADIPTPTPPNYVDHLTGMRVYDSNFIMGYKYDKLFIYNINNDLIAKIPERDILEITNEFVISKDNVFSFNDKAYISFDKLDITEKIQLSDIVIDCHNIDNNWYYLIVKTLSGEKVGEIGCADIYSDRFSEFQPIIEKCNSIYYIKIKHETTIIHVSGDSISMLLKEPDFYTPYSNNELNRAHRITGSDGDPIARYMESDKPFKFLKNLDTMTYISTYTGKYITTNYTNEPIINGDYLLNPISLKMYNQNMEESDISKDFIKSNFKNVFGENAPSDVYEISPNSYIVYSNSKINKIKGDLYIWGKNAYIIIDKTIFTISPGTVLTKDNILADIKNENDRSFVYVEGSDVIGIKIDNTTNKIIEIINSKDRK